MNVAYLGNYPPIEVEPIMATPQNFAEVLAEHGAAVVDLVTPATPDAMLELAEQVGDPMPESDPNVQHNVIGDSVLRLVTQHGHDVGMHQQPFSASELTMHMERSLAPIDQQPTHLLLGCVVAPRTEAGGQTIVNPMSNLFRSLSEREQEILRAAHQQIMRDGNVTSVSPNTMISTRPENSREFFSFRDAGAYGVDWNIDFPQGTPPDTQTAIVDKIYTSLYAPSNISAIPWRVGRVVGVDNHRFFHARTQQTGPTDRELLRVRVQSRG